MIAACSSGSTSPAGDGPSSADGGAVSADGGLADNDGSVGNGDGGNASDGNSGSDSPFAGTGRDWSTYPAIVEQSTFTTLYAMSDMHGNFSDLTNLLTKAGLIPGAPASPSAAVWSGGDATLVMTGDMIDKGPSSPEIVDYMRALEVAATMGGGHVIVSLGNHEAEFLVDPMNSKATGSGGIDTELTGVTPAAYASAMDVHGKWLRNRPFGVRVEKWFFSHAGDTGGRTVAALEAMLRDAVDNHAYNTPDVVGTTGLLEGKDWYSADTTMGGRYAQAVGATHIAFGHNPHALGVDGAMAVDAQKTLFKMDCGIAAGTSNGSILRVTHSGANEVAVALVSDGTVNALYTGP